ncbi:2,5-diamino-6-(ribosylamino)-4(3H)-pyrimidinone 5'-phosphate reductase [Basidiobolus ranarum]|uniref:2,5-diamino-6-ribosylamino-4(3H)-pyrimidinone 5'-phosphate reductase n=1 Tax=Basidiobolus ranarum TaxID=34480 RepID=A0ABR2W492_9FUNG
MAGVREAKAFLSSVYQRSEESSHKRPYVTLAYAQSLDGKTSGPGGKQVAFSSNESLAMSHRLRMINDGILLGVGTVLNDDPRLTARIVEPNEIPVQPQPIILDSKLRFPLRSNLILSASQGGGKYPWIFCAPDYSPQRRQALEAAGVQIFVVSSQGDKLSIPEILRKTEELGIRKLMVEGGSNVIREFLASGYIDLCVITLAPVYIGGTGASSVVDGDNRPLSKLSDIRYHQFGIDMVVVGYASPTSHVGSVHGDSQNQFQQAAYPPSGTHPSSQQSYGGNIAPSSGYPPSHGSGYPPSNNSGYPPNNSSGYPPSNNSGYPPGNSSGYPPTSPTSNYPHTSPAGGYPPQASQTGGYSQRPQGGVYPPKLEAGPPLPPRTGTNISPQQGYPPTIGPYPPKTTSPVQSVPGRVSSPQGYSSPHGSIYPPQGSSGYPPQGNSGYPPAVSAPPKRDTGYPPQGGSGYPPQGGSG